MITNRRSIIFILSLLLIGLWGCSEDKYSFGDIITPTDLAMTAEVEGLDTSNPSGNGTGNVVITATATDAISYKIDFGDGSYKMVSSGDITHKYTSPGTFDYTVTVSAVGTAGATSTMSKKISVYVAFEIPAYILEYLTGEGSKVWMSANETAGHFGVGQTDLFWPNWYSAAANARDPLAYDDEVTFSRDELDNVYMTIDNKGLSFSTAAATTVYGFADKVDGMYAINTGGTQKLSFMDATSASTTENSTRIQFVVPGNGIIIFGTGGVTYEILSITATTLSIRNIGADGNAWYQILKVKE